MRRYATIPSFSGYDREEERRIERLFKRIFKTKKIRIAFDERELRYYVVKEDEVNETGGIEMRRCATITSFSGYDREEERRIERLFKRIFKTKKIRIAFDERELRYYVVTEDEVNEDENI